MKKATIEIECRNEEHLEFIGDILDSLEDVYVRDKFMHGNGDFKMEIKNDSSRT